MSEIEQLQAEIAELKAVLQSARIAANRDLEAKRAAEIDRDRVIHERDATLEAVRMVADGVYVALIRGPVAELPRLAPNLERRVRTWVESRIGPQYVTPKERAMRLFEESCELLQAEGISREKAIAQVDYVYSRPVGEPMQEAGGVASAEMEHLYFGSAGLIYAVSIKAFASDFPTGTRHSNHNGSNSTKYTGGTMTFQEYIIGKYYVIDNFICRGEDYKAAHPEIFGIACSPQGENRQSWG